MSVLTIVSGLLTHFFLELFGTYNSCNDLMKKFRYKICVQLPLAVCLYSRGDSVKL